MREFDWKPISSVTANKRRVAQFKKTFRLSRIAAEVLCRRGLKTEKEVQKHLYGALKDTYDPYLFPDMLKAVTRVRHARDKKENIMIHGDYDCDGITASAMVRHMMDDIGADPSTLQVWIPNRSMGYGVSKEAITKAIADNVKVLITCDCGSNDHKPLAMARKAGINVIVLDHHSYLKPPKVFAFLNPNEPYYPFSELCGGGMAFKFIQAMAKFEDKVDPAVYLDLAALATIADAVELKDENRIIVKEGLKRMQLTAFPGLRAILKVSSLLYRKITGEAIAFIIAPKINAPGRIDDPNKSLHLLLEMHHDKAEALAHELVRINKRRQEINSTIRDEAISMIEKDYQNDPFIVLQKDTWNKGVIGIVASTIVEIYHKPCCIISNGYGSVRTVPEFPLLKPLEACQEHFSRWGGHPMAAGLKVRKGHVDAFRKKINEVAGKTLPAHPRPYMVYDARIKLRDITQQLMEDLEKLEPFGQANPLPRFSVEDMYVARDRITKDGQHLQLTIRQGKALTSAVGFWMASYGEIFIDPAQKFDVLFSIERSRMGTPQMMIRDVKEVKIDW